MEHYGCEDAIEILFHQSKTPKLEKILEWYSQSLTEDERAAQFYTHLILSVNSPASINSSVKIRLNVSRDGFVTKGTFTIAQVDQIIKVYPKFVALPTFNEFIIQQTMKLNDSPSIKKWYKFIDFSEISPCQFLSRMNPLINDAKIFQMHIDLIESSKIPIILPSLQNKSVEVEKLNTSTNVSEKQTFSLKNTAEIEDFFNAFYNKNSAISTTFSVKEDNKIISTYSSQNNQINFEKRFSQALANKFVPLSKFTGIELEYSSECWTTDKLLNETDVDFVSQKSAKYKKFNTLPIKQLFLLDSTGRYSIIELEGSHSESLTQIFQKDQPVNCRVIEGCLSPLELTSGYKDASISVPSYWRLNSYCPDYQFKCRIGGFFTQVWTDSFGRDKINNKISIQMSGYGLFDEIYQPFIFAKKSYGVRKAHDKVDTPDKLNLGQYSGFSIIFGKSKQNLNFNQL